MDFLFLYEEEEFFEPEIPVLYVCRSLRATGGVANVHLIVYDAIAVAPSYTADLFYINPLGDPVSETTEFIFDRLEFEFRETQEQMATQPKIELLLSPEPVSLTRTNGEIQIKRIDVATGDLEYGGLAIVECDGETPEDPNQPAVGI